MHRNQQGVYHYVNQLELQTHSRYCCLLHDHERLASALNFFLVYQVRWLTDCFLTPGSSDIQLYLECPEVVTSAAVTPFFSTSKSAAISGQTVSKELHSQSWCPAQQGHPEELPEVRLCARACQLCILPFGHSWHCHQINLPLRNDVFSGKCSFSLFLSWSHCCSKACLAAAEVGCFCLVPYAFLPLLALAHLGHPVLKRVLFNTGACPSCKQALHFQWALMWLKTVTWSSDMRWFFLASQNNATSGAFLASVLC